MTHHDPRRPEFGYVPPGTHRSRANDAVDFAREERYIDSAAWMEQLLTCPELLPLALDTYRKADAALAYARAVRDSLAVGE